jgi:hypothetical protein
MRDCAKREAYNPLYLDAITMDGNEVTDSAPEAPQSS